MQPILRHVPHRGEFPVCCGDRRETAIAIGGNSMPCPGDPGPRPSFIPVPDVARTVMKYNIFGQTVENVHYFSKSGGFDAAALDALNDAIVDAWGTTLRALQPPQLQLLEVISTAQEVVSGAQDSDIVAANGTNASASTNALNATFAIKFTTGLSGRSYRGRMYWPALVGVEILNNEVSSTYAADMRDAVMSFFAEIFDVAGAVHVVVSYQNDCEWNTTGVATPVTGYSYTDLHVDSQRRRLSGRGV